jgi:hypothetical protein
MELFTLVREEENQSGSVDGESSWLNVKNRDGKQKEWSDSNTVPQELKRMEKKSRFTDPSHRRMPGLTERMRWICREITLWLPIILLRIWN